MTVRLEWTDANDSLVAYAEIRGRVINGRRLFSHASARARVRAYVRDDDIERAPNWLARLVLRVIQAARLPVPYDAASIELSATFRNSNGQVFYFGEECAGADRVRPWPPFGCHSRYIRKITANFNDPYEDAEATATVVVRGIPQSASDGGPIP